MGIVFKTETSVLKVISNVSELSDQEMDQIRNKYDNKEILKYEIEFKEGVKVLECHDIGNMRPDIVSMLTITIQK